MTPSSHQVTQLLKDWSNGDQVARDELMSLVYEELHRLAHQYMSRERTGNTLHVDDRTGISGLLRAVAIRARH
jgi:hypothetical protein